MDFWHSLAGMVTLELTSGDLSNRLKALNEAGVPLSHIHCPDEMTARFQVARGQVRTVAKMVKRRGDRLRVVNRLGIYWQLRSLAGRKLLVLGLAAQLLVMLWLPTRVLFVRVEGNHRIPERLIVEAAGETGIGFGASRRAVRSEKMKNALLARVPELQWAGVNTYGCQAVITVREREQPPGSEVKSQVGSIVAARDGIILSATVTRGSSLCVPGQAVEAGETLISGYTDCGLTITAQRAEGDILAATSRELEAVTPSKTLQRGEPGKKWTGYSLVIGKKRINFYNGSGILGGRCVRMYSEYVLTLPGGFQLPVKLLRQTGMEYEVTESDVDSASAEAALRLFASDCLKDQMIAGEITAREEYTSLDEDVYRLRGRYACREMIGRYREEKIGEDYGKTDRTDGER